MLVLILRAYPRDITLVAADPSFPRGERVSVVLEQYRVPPGLREFTLDFEIVEGG